MNNSQSWTVTCQDAKDGSGDFIIDLPPDLLTELGLGVGDVLTVVEQDGDLPSSSRDGLGFSDLSRKASIECTQCCVRSSDSYRS
ncbi:hypothetical protein EMIT0324P_21178 [Pseudomonas chlororaphis]